MIANILIGLGIGLILGILVGGVVGLIAGYDWRAGQEARVAPIANMPERVAVDEGEPARIVWPLYSGGTAAVPPAVQSHVKGPLD